MESTCALPPGDTRACAEVPPPARRRRRVRWALGAGAVVLALVLAHRPLLVGFAYAFRVDDPAPSDALVLLVGGVDHRPATTLDLYRRGQAPVILMGDSGVIPVLDVDPSEKTRQMLIREGVPADAVRILPGGKVSSTRDEALRVRAYAETHPFRRITVVTTAFHTARARWVFRRSLRGLNVEVRMAASKHPAFSEADWYRTEDGLLSYFEELVKTVFYRLSY